VAIGPAQSPRLETHVSVCMPVGPEAQQNCAGAVHVVVIPHATLYGCGPVSTTDVSGIGAGAESMPEPVSIGGAGES
jgi:hypothetical protein